MRSRPALAVRQPSDGGRARAKSTTTAAWHRANSYLETLGTVSRAGDASDHDVERGPLIPKDVSTATEVDEPHGGSTVTQTSLNSMNTLLGVGLLSLPLGFLYSGWLIGSLLLLTFALLTFYTAKLLARCMDSDPNCKSYIDIASKAYGTRGRLVTIFLFNLITITACVALVILFADAMYALIPNLTRTQWKLICGLVLLPLHFMPFHVLSMASILGIGACVSMVVLVLLEGFGSDGPDGSLWHPAYTTLLPQDWSKMPLSLGLLMSPWTAHAILPNLYRDMAEPAKYGRAVGWAFGGTYLIDVTISASGYLMYGSDTSDAIVNNVIRTTNRRALAVALTVLVALMPVSKVPLL
jgi:solute carrier family 32 (vesicular inhibitory amino acid transporter)